MILSRDASSKSQKHFMMREASEERIKTTLDRLTVKEDPPYLSNKNFAGGNPTNNQDILPFTDFGNKAVWEATEGRNQHIVLANVGGSHGSGHSKYKYLNHQQQIVI